MNDERTFAERVARHAALADAARLRMIDLLTLGDRSSSELQSLLDLPSNLLAHHLKVLERAGLIARARSEADRRRSYVRLLPGALDELGVGSSVSATRIVFVCTANSARSQLAVALWKQASTVPAASGGTHPASSIEPGAIAAAGRHGLKLSGRPHLLDDVRRPGDIVVTVCDNAHEDLALPESLHWSIPDPVRSGAEADFESAFAELARRVDDLAPRILAA